MITQISGLFQKSQKQSSELSFVILFQKDQTPRAGYGLLIK